MYYYSFFSNISLESSFGCTFFPKYNFFNFCLFVFNLA